MFLQAVRRLRDLAQRRTSMVLKALFVLTLAAAGFLGFTQPAHAAPLPFGDAGDCEGLARGATVSRTDLASRPFDAAQIPGSPSFTFTSVTGDTATLVACQQKV